jgi:hypothetical protein
LIDVANINTCGGNHHKCLNGVVAGWQKGGSLSRERNCWRGLESGHDDLHFAGEGDLQIIRNVYRNKGKCVADLEGLGEHFCDILLGEGPHAQGNDIVPDFSTPLFGATSAGGDGAPKDFWPPEPANGALWVTYT